MQLRRFCRCWRLPPRIVLQMIDDEPLNNTEEDSPPPPAPNGEHSLVAKYHQTTKQQTLDTSWNPFHTPSIQLQQVCIHNQIVNCFWVPISSTDMFVHPWLVHFYFFLSLSLFFSVPHSTPFHLCLSTFYPSRTIYFPNRFWSLCFVVQHRALYSQLK